MELTPSKIAFKSINISTGKAAQDSTTTIKSWK